VTRYQPKSEKKQNRRSSKEGQAPRHPVWQPQPIGLTRDELRILVADMIG
jgi:hypothetical protein